MLYRDILNELMDGFPSIEPLRLPKAIEETSQGGDLDILIPKSEYPELADWLELRDFKREHCDQSYRRIWRRRSIEENNVYTVDIYFERQWGMGYKLRKQYEMSPSTARFLRAVIDKRSRDYATKVYPDIAPSSFISFSRAAALCDRLWRRNRMRTLLLVLLFLRFIQIDMESVFGYFGNRVRFRATQLFGKRGLEIAIAGVDGSGKTSLARSLESRLPAPVKTIYLGSNHYLTPMTKALSKADRPQRYLWFIASHIEMFYRRLIGHFWAKRGFVVVYDRHPLERLQLQNGLKARINNSLVRAYTPGIDQTFLLHGSVGSIHARKPEHSPPKLARMESVLRAQLAIYGINKLAEINTTDNSIEITYTHCAKRILELLDYA